MQKVYNCSLERYGIETCLGVSTYEINECVKTVFPVLLWVERKPHPPWLHLAQQPPAPGCWEHHSPGSQDTDFKDVVSQVFRPSSKQQKNFFGPNISLGFLM